MRRGEDRGSGRARRVVRGALKLKGLAPYRPARDRWRESDIHLPQRREADAPPHHPNCRCSIAVMETDLDPEARP